MQQRDSAVIVWDYLCMSLPLPLKADVVIGLGSHDVGVARHAADLVRRGLAPLLLFSGGKGKDTPLAWGDSEAEYYADIARDLGVPRDRIVVECHATNTGDNVRLSRELLKQLNRPVSTAVFATKPYMQRRAYATVLKQWPKLQCVPSSETDNFDEYYNREDVDYVESVNLMVGDLQRMRRYADLGYQAPQFVPDAVWCAFEDLVSSGFNRYVLR